MQHELSRPYFTSLLGERHGEAQTRPGMLPGVSDNLSQKPLGLTYVFVALSGEGGLLPAMSDFAFRSMAVEEKLAEVELRRGADKRGVGVPAKFVQEIHYKF